MFFFCGLFYRRAANKHVKNVQIATNSTCLIFSSLQPDGASIRYF